MLIERSCLKIISVLLHYYVVSDDTPWVECQTNPHCVHQQELLPLILQKEGTVFVLFSDFLMADSDLLFSYITWQSEAFVDLHVTNFIDLYLQYIQVTTV